MPSTLGQSSDLQVPISGPITKLPRLPVDALRRATARSGNRLGGSSSGSAGVLRRAVAQSGIRFWGSSSGSAGGLRRAVIQLGIRFGGSSSGSAQHLHVGNGIRRAIEIEKPRLGLGGRVIETAPEHGGYRERTKAYRS